MEDRKYWRLGAQLDTHSIKRHDHSICCTIRNLDSDGLRLNQTLEKIVLRGMAGSDVSPVAMSAEQATVSSTDHSIGY